LHDSRRLSDLEVRRHTVIRRDRRPVTSESEPTDCTVTGPVDCVEFLLGMTEGQDGCETKSKFAGSACETLKMVPKRNDSGTIITDAVVPKWGCFDPQIRGFSESLVPDLSGESTEGSIEEGFENDTDCPVSVVLRLCLRWTIAVRGLSTNEPWLGLNPIASVTLNVLLKGTSPITAFGDPICVDDSGAAGAQPEIGQIGYRFKRTGCACIEVCNILQPGEAVNWSLSGNGNGQVDTVANNTVTWSVRNELGRNPKVTITPICPTP